MDGVDEAAQLELSEESESLRGTSGDGKKLVPGRAGMDHKVYASG